MADPAAAGLALTKAVVRAADYLALPGGALATVIGVSPATVSRMKRGGFTLAPVSKEFELGVLFVRLFRSLDAIVGGDRAVARAWLAGDNLALGGRPVDKIKTISGLSDVVAYLDSRRAVV
jgi:hypothetical protein